MPYYGMSQHVPHQWLDPKGNFHVLGDNVNNHFDWITKNTEHKSIEEAMQNKWHRVFQIGEDIYSHNDFHPPTLKQKNELKDLAIVNGKRQVYHTQGNEDKTIYSNPDRYNKRDRAKDILRYAKEYGFFNKFKDFFLGSTPVSKTRTEYDGPVHSGLKKNKLDSDGLAKAMSERSAISTALQQAGHNTRQEGFGDLVQAYVHRIGHLVDKAPEHPLVKNYIEKAKRISSPSVVDSPMHEDSPSQHRTVSPENDPSGKELTEAVLPIVKEILPLHIGELRQVMDNLRKARERDKPVQREIPAAKKEVNIPIEEPKLSIPTGNLDSLPLAALRGEKGVKGGRHSFIDGKLKQGLSYPEIAKHLQSEYMLTPRQASATVAQHKLKNAVKKYLREEYYADDSTLNMLAKQYKYGEYEFNDKYDFDEKFRYSMNKKIFKNLLKYAAAKDIIQGIHPDIAARIVEDVRQHHLIHNPTTKNSETYKLSDGALDFYKDHYAKTSGIASRGYSGHTLADADNLEKLRGSSFTVQPVHDQHGEVIKNANGEHELHITHAFAPPPKPVEPPILLQPGKAAGISPAPTQIPNTPKKIPHFGEDTRDDVSDKIAKEIAQTHGKDTHALGIKHLNEEEFNKILDRVTGGNSRVDLKDVKHLRGDTVTLTPSGKDKIHILHNKKKLPIAPRALTTQQIIEKEHGKVPNDMSFDPKLIHGAVSQDADYFVPNRELQIVKNRENRLNKERFRQKIRAALSKKGAQSDPNKLQAGDPVIHSLDENYKRHVVAPVDGNLKEMKEILRQHGHEILGHRPITQKEADVLNGSGVNNYPSSLFNPLPHYITAAQHTTAANGRPILEKGEDRIPVSGRRAPNRRNSPLGEV